MGAITTEFGRELRKIRLETGEVLKDMADKLGFTASYLSAIEVGKRVASDKVLAKLQEIYRLPEERMDELKKAVEQDMPKIEINLNDTSSNQRKTVIAFARTFRSLDAKTMEDILKLVEDNK
ncbi:MAG: helix-turn-helix domain-containing protein [Lentisphaeria bacterium]|nr:helix-turn-helix domain-containing protein [Lentisphaeria bacterium]